MTFPSKVYSMISCYWNNEIFVVKSYILGLRMQKKKKIGTLEIYKVDYFGIKWYYNSFLWLVDSKPLIVLIFQTISRCWYLCSSNAITFSRKSGLIMSSAWLVRTSFSRK